MRYLPLWLALALAGCTTPLMAPPAQPGQSEAEVVARLGAPTGRYTLPEGGTRLEYATGPYGRQTWMVDLDRGGRVVVAQQVLTAENLAAFQAKAPGMPREQLLATIGRPGERRGGGRQGGEVWSWRYQTNDCLWFQVSIADDGRVRDGAFGIDPTCDAPSNRR